MKMDAFAEASKTNPIKANTKPIPEMSKQM
jgi:hypothetical protein